MTDIFKYRFDVINVTTGREEPYIGIFDSRKKADEWFCKHGMWHIRNQRPLILVKCETKNKDSFSEDDIEDYVEQG